METIHVLIAGDDQAVATLKAVLHTEPGDMTHYHMEVETDYTELLRKLVRNTHDIYVIDQKIRDVPATGQDLIRKANAGGCSSPAILLTTLSDEDAEMVVEDVGAAGFLNIHLDLEERVVKHAIRHAIRHFRQLQDIHNQLTHVQQQLLDIGRALNRR